MLSGISVKSVGRYDVALLNPVICTVSLGAKCILIQIALTLSICQSLEAVITQLVNRHSLFKIFLFSALGLENYVFTASEEKDMLNGVL